MLAGTSLPGATNEAVTKPVSNVPTTAPTPASKTLAKKALQMPIKAPAKASTRVPVKPAGQAAAKPVIGTPSLEANVKPGAASAGASASSKGKGKAEATPKAARAKNAYMFFLADKRAAAKCELVLTTPCIDSLPDRSQMGHLHLHQHYW